MKGTECLTAVAALAMLVGRSDRDTLSLATKDWSGFARSIKNSSRPIQPFQPATAPWLQSAWQRD